MNIKSLVSKAKHITTLKLGVVNKNKPNEYQGRSNIENIHQLSASNLRAGSRYSVDVTKDMLTITACTDGDYVVAPKEHKRRDGSVIVGSRVDVRLKALEGNFINPDELLVYYLENSVVVTSKPTDINNEKRIQALKNAIDKKEFNKASLYSGIGSLDSALHSGFAKNGITTKLTMANDIWDKALTALYENNPAATKKTKTYAIGIEQLCAMGGSPYKNITMLTAGILCKGASKLNTATRDLPEMHTQSGHQILNFSMVLQAMQWHVPLILIENVTAWASTVSASMMERVFKEQGYDVMYVGDVDDNGKYQGMDSSQYGDIEKRVRMGMLAYPKGVDIDMSLMEQLKRPSTRTVGDIRFQDSEIDLAEYAKGLNLDSDSKKAKGWVNRVVSDDTNKTPSCSADCWKQRPEDPKFMHQTIEGQSRLPLPEEHASLKGQPHSLINALPYNSNAHTALGNGTCHGVWEAFGFALSTTLLSWSRSYDLKLAA